MERQLTPPSLVDVDLRAHRIIAAAVLVVSLILYFSTIAPTTSFWDCGEFIACSYSLGVPHPPGAPFFLLIGRLFSMVMPLPDIGLRVNALSALVSALTVLLTYLMIVRLLRRWRGPEKTVYDKTVLYGSGVVGALGFAASHSFWFNAVEAEVYAISMFFTALVFWLAIRWMDKPDEDDATRYLLLISYFVGLAIGVHLLNVLALCPIILLIYFQKYRFTWKGFALAMLISFAAIGVVYPGIVGGVPALLEAGVIWKVLVLAALIGVTFLAIRARRYVLSVVMTSVLLVLIGYSTYAVIYIRSNLDPEINENQPDTVQRLISYLNREQYGAVGPVELQNAGPSYRSRLEQQGAIFMPLAGDTILRFHILERSAPLWSYQINQMYIRYLSWQYFVGERGQPFIVPFLLGLMGMVWHFWRDPKRSFSVMMLFVMTGIAIVFYLNQDNPQPRERDYAYVGSFFAFALWIGLGVAALVEFIEDMVKNPSPGAKRIVAFGVVGLMLLAVPVNMIAQNYDSHSRAGNYVAWDYSRNMLESCEPNGIIFTNGDNDTFPLWYLQVVEGLRRDVRVVNLSLLNTDWYIKQLRDKEPQVAIAFSDRDIDQRLTGRSDEALLLRYWPPGDRSWEIRGREGRTMNWDVPATMYVPTGMPGEEPGVPNFLRVQDIMVLHIIEQNKWRKPIYFAVTVSQSNLIGLNDYLAMEGLVFRLHDRKVREIDVPRLRENLFETYTDHYRNLDNPDVHYFPNVIKLLQNYRSGFLQLVYEYYRTGTDVPGLETDSGIPREQWAERFNELTAREKALHTLHRMDEVIPPEVIPVTSRDVVLQVARIYHELGDAESGNRYLRIVEEQTANDIEGKLQVAYYYAQYGGADDRAVRMIEEVLAERSDAATLFNAAAIYDRIDREDKMREILQQIENAEDLSFRDELDLATYYYTVADYDRAAQIYERLAEERPSSGEVYGGMLSVYEAMKDTGKVIEILNYWLELYPDDTEARSLLESYGGSVGG